MDWQQDLLGFAIGVVLATITTPVGVSGAVFLLPVQLSVFAVPNPAVTPTNLLYNVIAGPPGLVRLARKGRVDRPLAASLLRGTIPGVVLGALLRIFVAADPDTFRLLAAAVLAPTGALVLWRPHRPPAQDPRIGSRTVTALAFVAGVVGGLYGIGGGSLLGPILVGAGFAVARVGPAALLSTWITSVCGVVTYAVVALHADGAIAPDWDLGIATGLGGGVGSWLGASLQPRIPERALRITLGLAGLALAGMYVAQATT